MSYEFSAKGSSLPKLLLPSIYHKQGKEGQKKYSPFFKYLMSKGEAKNHKITKDSNDVRIANDSINRAKAKPESHKRYNLINEGISQTRGGDFVSYSAMVEQSLHLLIKLINEKNIQLLSHSSLEFYEKAIINKK